MMFKNNSWREKVGRFHPSESQVPGPVRYLLSVRYLRSVPGSRRFSEALLGLVLGISCGCRTLPTLPAANLGEPGWSVRQGQAVWRRARGGAEIAGELLVGTRTNGDAFVQFTKTPFPLVIAQLSAQKWQIQSPAQNETYTRYGKPPEGIIWFCLARALADGPVPKQWSWQVNEGSWSLMNRGNGESLAGYFLDSSVGPAGTGR